MFHRASRPRVAVRFSGGCISRPTGGRRVSTPRSRDLHPGGAERRAGRTAAPRLRAALGHLRRGLLAIAALGLGVLAAAAGAVLLLLAWGWAADGGPGRIALVAAGAGTLILARAANRQPSP